MILRPGLREKAPGLVLVALATGVSLVLAPALTAATGAAVSPLVVALGVGALLGSFRVVPRGATPGVSWVGSRVLRAGVVLLGLQLSLGQLAGLGWRGALVVTTTVLCTFLVTLRTGAALRVDPRVRLYVATGFSICGAAAIAAMSGTVGQRTAPPPGPGSSAGHAGRAAGVSRASLAPDGPSDSDAVGTALALVTLYGTLAVLALPWLVGVLGLSDDQAGLLIGASVQEVGQVVAAAGAVSAPALAAATVAKLARVVLLAPLTAAVAARVRREEVAALPGGRGLPGEGEVGRGSAPPRLVPGFVLAFLGAVLVRSTGVLPEWLLGGAEVVQQVLLTAAMVALGTGVDVRRLVRSGARPLALGAVATVVAVGTATAGTLVLG